MNLGFFSASETRSTKFIPPRPTVEFPRLEPKKPKPPIDLSTSRQLLMDIECYPNYFLVKFLRLSDDKLFGFEKTQDTILDRQGILGLVKRYEVITFNGNGYDVSILKYALTGASNKALKTASDELIHGKVWEFEKEHRLYDVDIKHIDISELLPGFVSLKIHGGRLHCKTLRDLPYHDKTILTRTQMDEVDSYCGNDLCLTKLVTLDLWPQIQLRRDVSAKYKMDLMSKSDAQIAEAVIKSELEKVKGCEISRPTVEAKSFYYRAPDFIKFRGKALQEVLEIVTTRRFQVSDAGHTSMPKELSDLKVKLGSSVYKMGIGGLHSSEKTAFHVSDRRHSIHDWDVTSFYPSIILECELFPKQLGRDFLIVFGGLTDERVEAKKSGDKVKADSFKIVINGTFGKTGSPYSILYQPEMMIQITVTGQLSLLMLIEMLETEGISVVSGNTDGVVVKCPRCLELRMRSVIKRWERITGFNMEESQYAGLYSRDVNNYIAIKTNGEVKTKGTFSPASLSKNPENDICSTAMIEYLKYGTPFEQTIRSCRDITQFLTLRSVKEGAVKCYGEGELPPHNTKEELCVMAGYYQTDENSWRHKEAQGELAYTTLEYAYKDACRRLKFGQQTVYLGKAIRWYHAKGVSGSIQAKNSGIQVAMTEGARPLMTLSDDFPADIDYDWYVAACDKLFR